MPASVEQAPWVIVAGGFHEHGGMDRANAALAAYLLESGVPVHLVGHEIDLGFIEDPLATVHVVPRPRGLPGLAERLLARTGVRVARTAAARHPLPASSSTAATASGPTSTGCTPFMPPGRSSTPARRGGAGIAIGG